MFNATCNNISAIACGLVILMEETLTRIHGDTCRTCRKYLILVGKHKYNEYIILCGVSRYITRTLSLRTNVVLFILPKKTNVLNIQPCPAVGKTPFVHVLHEKP